MNSFVIDSFDKDIKVTRKQTFFFLSLSVSPQLGTSSYLCLLRKEKSITTVESVREVSVSVSVLKGFYCQD